MKICKECNQEISSTAKKCPNCGKDQRNFFGKHKILTVIIALFILGGVISAMSGGGSKATVSSNTSSSSDSSKNKDTVAKIGDVIKTDKYEIIITSVQQRTQVGGEYLQTKPSEGGIYVVVNWQYKNITKEPISSLYFPQIHLNDKDGTKYDADINASSYYATETKLDTKILSDLNPGITVKGAEVFEISKDTYSAGGWKVYIDADKDAYVAIN